MNVDERTLPNNLDAERSVLGAILVHNAAYDRVSQILSARDFYRDAHRRIFARMAVLIDERRTAVDFLTLKEELARVGELEEVGGPSYVAALCDGLPHSVNAEHYARIVKEKAALRGMIDAANTMLREAYEAEAPASTILQAADRALVDLQRGHESRLVDLRGSVSAIMNRLEHRYEHRGELSGVDTGFASINDVTFGWQASDLIVLAARPSIGKTAFILNTAITAARQQRRVALFSLEMRKEQIEDRMLAALTGISLTRIMSGYLGGPDHEKLVGGYEAIRELAIFIDDRGGQTVPEIRSACRHLKSEHGLDLVIVDYVQLMPGTVERRGATRTEEVTDISRRLKLLADDISAPIILLSQLNRGAKDRTDKRPRLEDLRESGSLEQDADIVAFLHRKNHRESGLTKFIIEKQRNGPTGECHLTIDRDTQTFTDGGVEESEPPKAEKTEKRKRGARLPMTEEAPA